MKRSALRLGMWILRLAPVWIGAAFCVTGGAMLGLVAAIATVAVCGWLLIFPETWR